MELYIGNTLKKLRLTKGLTQEEVATQLGISPQSISKWERGDGYPDITMLPALANYFCITVDELIGMDKINAANTLDTINQLWTENRKNQKHSENVALMKEALKTYPNHPLLLVQLSASLERLDGTDAQRHENLRESIAVQEQILQYCDDCEVRAATLFNISDAYYRYGDYEKALAYADKLPNLYKTRESALVRILTDPQEKNRIAKSALEPLLWQLTLHLTTLAETENDKRYIEKLSQIREILS